MTRSPRFIALFLSIAIIVCLAPAAPAAFVSRGAFASKGFGAGKTFTSLAGFRSSLVSAIVEDNELGRWKEDGNGGCYWDENDEGPDQCDPNNPDGRYKDDGNGGCYWEPNDFGPDQCDPNSPPPSGQYRLDGDGRCYFDPNGTGAHECTATPIGPGDGYGTNVQTPCGFPETGCQPQRWFFPAVGKICYSFNDASVPAGKEADWAKIKTGFAFGEADWNKKMREWRMPNRLDECGGGYVVSWSDSNADFGVTTPNPDYKSGTITTGYLAAHDAHFAELHGHGEQAFFNSVMGHELGHVLGFDDSQCGQNNSLMHETRNYSQPFAVSVQCADLLLFFWDRVTGRFGGGDLGGGAAGNPGGYQESDCRYGRAEDFTFEKWMFCTPIVIDLDAGPFEMSPPDVWFNLTGGGPGWFGWTPARSTTVGWLVLDRDGDGMIWTGAELFGNFTPLSDGLTGPSAKHGFEALAWFDRPSSGGNNDGWIDREDAVYGRLRMWFDVNHDGTSQRSELRTLDESRVAAVSLRAYPSRRHDKYGNQILLKSEARVVLPNGNEVRRPAYDVLLVVR